MATQTHPADLPVDEFLRSCEIKRTRGSGPGGQHRNKVETAIVVTHLPSGLTGQASERRSQRENQSMAIQRLRVTLAIDVRNDRGPLESYRPTATWRARVRGRRIEVSPEHEDLPRLLAEAMDVMALADFDAAEPARVLGCSATQLVRFLAREPRAIGLVNRRRSELGKKPLKT